MAVLIRNVAIRKLPLSGGTANGRRIKVAATADPGTLIHTGPADATMIDEVWLDAYNSSVAPAIIYVEWGGNTAPDDIFQVTLPAQSGLSLIAAGNVLVGATTALLIKAYASTANVITLGGYVHRMQ